MELCDPADPPSKRALLAAALRLFARDGYRETTIRAIAEEAGYTNPALFKFFASKDELGAHVFARCHGALVARVAPHLEGDAPLEEALAGWVHAWIELLGDARDAVLFVHEHAATFWPLVGGGGDDPFAALTRWLRRARNDGRVSSAVPLRLQALLVVGTFHQVARHVDVARLGPAQRSRLADDVARVLAGGLRA